MIKDTIPDRLMRNGRIHPDAPAYYVKRAQGWVPTTWQEFSKQVRQAAAALIGLGLKPGEGVAIMGFNRPEWVIFDLACMTVGGYAAGIYATNSPSEVQYVIENSDSKIVLLEDEKQWDKLNQVRDQVGGLRHVIMMRGAQVKDPMVMDWETFVSHGTRIDPSQVDERLAGLRMEQLAAMIYTSGTTGPPKGAMLSHQNLAWTAAQGTRLFEITPEDSILTYLPLSHAAEQMFAIHAAVTGAIQVYFAQYPPQVHLNDDFKEVSPTIIFGVPRVWERFADGVRSILTSSTGLSGHIARWALGVGRRASVLRHRNQRMPIHLRLQHELAEVLVYSRVKKGLGLSRARYCLTGAAPIEAEIIEFFNALDVPLLEIYGQTEVSGPSSVNLPGATKIGSVGRAWPGVQIRIAEDGEVLVKGPNVFMGYYRNPEATASDLVDGWLHTGDLGELDDDGFLTIIGRKKELLITASGLNVTPHNIEMALRSLPLVSQAVCIGDKRRYITCLITLDQEAASKFASDCGLDCHDLHTNPLVIDAIRKGIDEEVNSQLSHAKQVRNFHILPRDFTIQDGELTPTLKLKRSVINQNFGQVIEEMYSAEL